jgi:hypothetical protein
MDTALLDTAYLIRKGGPLPVQVFLEATARSVEEKYEADLRQLLEQFPSVERARIEEAYARAGHLSDMAFAVINEHRDSPKEEHLQRLARECPGFSAKIYETAYGFGMFESR